jgi:proteasome accessory factor B
MPRWERIGRIHDLLEEGAYPNATSLARQLNLTIKTIHRDVAYMREHLGLPVAFDPVRLGYYYNQAVACRPTQPLTDPELFGLLVAYRAVAYYTGTEMEASLRSTMRKLTPQMESGEFIVIDDIRAAMSHLPRNPDPATMAENLKVWRTLKGDDSASNDNNSKSLAA